MLGGSGVGVVGGFLGGAAIGGTECNNAPSQCGLAPLAYGFVEAGVGAMVTTPLTAHVTSKAVGADPKRVLRNVGITAAASTGLLLIGSAGGWSGPQMISAAGFVIALPIVADFSAGQSVRERQSNIARRVEPRINGRTTGFTIRGTF